MTQYTQAWQCIGCGRIEAPQPCIGLCRDRKILMIGKADHERVIEELGRVREKTLAAQGVLSRLALSTPRDGQWESSYRALQQQARVVLATLTPTDVSAVEARIGAAHVGKTSQHAMPGGPKADAVE